MIRFLAHRLLDRFSRRHNYDVAYMRMILDASPAGFRKFMALSALSGHHEAAPPQASHAARLVGVLAEDCGPCTQLVTDMARTAGLSDAQIVAVLTGNDDALDPPVRLARRFASALVNRSSDLDDLREQVRQQWGDKGIIDLTFATQTTRLYPMAKIGLGFAVVCQQVRVGSTIVAVNGKLNA